jgi:glycosyltransferase involved in cell wall biosynthesis
VLLEVYERLARKNNITVITSAAAGERPRTEEIRGMRVVRLGARRLNIPGAPMPLLVFDGLRDAIVRADADIYHINNRYQYFTGTVSAIRGINRRMALTIHNALPKNIGFMTDGAGRLYDWAWGRRLMAAADVITGVSAYAVRTTVPREYSGKAHVVYNGVDHNVFRKAAKGSAGVKRALDSLGFGGGANIITNGRLVPQKGQIYLMRAFAELAGKLDVNLVIIGDGPLKGRLYRYARRRGLEGRFRIVYGLSGKEVADHYNASDVFAFPSLYEPFGLAVYEALACELPSLMTRVGGISEIADGCGFYIRPRDSGSIKRAVLRVMDNRKGAERLARKGRRRVVRNCDWDAISRRYETLFQQAIRN